MYQKKTVSVDKSMVVDCILGWKYDCQQFKLWKIFLKIVDFDS